MKQPTKINFVGLAHDKMPNFKKAQSNLFSGMHSRFDDPGSHEKIREVKTLSSEGFLKLMHVELENWYDSTKADFHNVENRLKNLKKTHATLSMQFHRSKQDENEYKKELNL